MTLGIYLAIVAAFALIAPITFAVIRAKKERDYLAALVKWDLQAACEEMAKLKAATFGAKLRALECEHAMLLFMAGETDALAEQLNYCDLTDMREYRFANTAIRGLAESLNAPQVGITTFNAVRFAPNAILNFYGLRVVSGRPDKVTCFFYEIFMPLLEAACTASYNPEQAAMRFAAVKRYAKIPFQAHCADRFLIKLAGQV